MGPEGEAAGEVVFTVSEEAGKSHARTFPAWLYRLLIFGLSGALLIILVLYCRL